MDTDNYDEMADMGLDHLGDMDDEEREMDEEERMTDEEGSDANADKKEGQVC